MANGAMKKTVSAVAFRDLPEWAQQIVVGLPADTLGAIAEALEVEPRAFTIDRRHRVYFGTIILGSIGPVE
jgi:hypothetical protein